MKDFTLNHEGVLSGSKTKSFFLGTFFLFLLLFFFLDNNRFEGSVENTLGNSNYNLKNNLGSAMCGSYQASADVIVAQSSGNWNDPTVWSSGQVPQDNDEISISQGVIVTINRKETARIKHISLSGSLVFDQNAQSELLVETILVNGSGSIIIGTEGDPFPETSSAKIIFIDNGELTDLRTDERGLVVLGKLSVYGSKKEPYVKASDAESGAQNIIVENLQSADWKVGDEIVIPSVEYLPGELTLNLAGNELNSTLKPSRESIANSFQDEKVTITRIRDNRINFRPALTYDHVRPKATLPYHIANLSRNIVFESEAVEDFKRRGHTMFMVGSDVHIQGAKFHRLGRTDKRNALDDFDVNTKQNTGSERGKVRRKTDPSDINNARGRYAVHFHRIGFNGSDVNQALATVTNCVVEDTPGWGYVNHSSHVDFKYNVCFNFLGSGFVTELGDELGSFDNNIAIQGHGNGELRERRLGFNMLGRMPTINDFGFGGDGFWFQGPAVSATNNISVSCNGSGMIWFATGGVRDELVYTNNFTKSQIAGIKYGLASQVYPGIQSGSIKPREIPLPSGAEKELVTSDMPILKCDGNIAYACHIGLNTRFCNNTNNTFYGQFNLDYDKAFISEDTKRTTQFVNGQILWNNFLALSSSYTTQTEFDNIEIYNGIRRAYPDNNAIIDFAVQGEHSNNLVFRNTSIEGYGLGAIWARRGSKFTSEDEIVKHALLENREHFQNNREPVDSIVVSNELNLDGSGVRISFNEDTRQLKVAIRYKAVDDRYWTYQDFTTSSNFVRIDLPRLDVDYEYQLLRGGSNTVSSMWSETGILEARVVTSTENVIEDKPSFVVYPNPTKGAINFSDETSWVLSSMDGKEITSGNSQKVDVSGLPSGIYLLNTPLGVERIVLE